MPLVPRFLRPAPMVRVDDTWPPIDPTRHRVVTPEPVQAPPPNETTPHRASDDARRDDNTPPPPIETKSNWDFAAAREEERVRLLAAKGAPPAERLVAAAELRDAMRKPAQDADALARERDRFLCDTLHLFRICARPACQRAQACRDDPHVCLLIGSDAIPDEAREWALRLIEAGETGESLSELEAAYPDEQLAYRCWIAGLNARITRNTNRRRRVPPPEASADDDAGH